MNGIQVNPIEISNYTGIPYGLYTSAYQDEISNLYSDKVLRDLARIIEYYKIYDEGAAFVPEGNKDYEPADLMYGKAASRINKQARFMFGKPAEFILSPADPDDDSESTKKAVSQLQSFVNKVLEENAFANKCLKGFKDCCIGERVAITLDFNTKGIFIRFLPSYSFIYTLDESGDLNKLITFYTIQDSMEKKEQRIYKKKWELAETGYCRIVEAIYDGMGQPVEEETVIMTKFKYIPCWVVLNDGLTGDEDGESDIKLVANHERWYNKLANADIDSGRQNMNPIRWARDMSPESTENLSIAAGAFWDLTSDSEVNENRAGEVGVLETNMNFSEPVGKTLERLESSMNEVLDIPNISADSMVGIMTSGKTMQAVYWGLVMRCDEKSISWNPALLFVVNTIIDGARLYPESIIEDYEVVGRLPDILYTLKVENPYALPQDDNEEKALDLQMVNAQVMSRKTFIKRWQNITDKEAEKELRQIVEEQALFEDSYTQDMISAANRSINSDPEDI